MPRWPDKWIVVHNWDKFQNYTRRHPPWIKNYTDLLHKPEYLDLSLKDRGLLHIVWLAYADNDGLLRQATVTHLTTPNTHGMSVRDARRVLNSHHVSIKRSLVRLNHAGFIGFLASKPLSLNRSSLSTRARENKKPKICPFCEVGGGRHTTDCPTQENHNLMVDHLMAAARA